MSENPMGIKMVVGTLGGDLCIVGVDMALAHFPGLEVVAIAVCAEAAGGVEAFRRLRNAPLEIAGAKVWVYRYGPIPFEGTECEHIVAVARRLEEHDRPEPMGWVDLRKRGAA